MVIFTDPKEKEITKPQAVILDLSEALGYAESQSRYFFNVTNQIDVSMAAHSSVEKFQETLSKHQAIIEQLKQGRGK